MATLQEIARTSGVTDATVSRVLTGAYVPKRRDAILRARQIQRIAEQMGYRPSTAARATRTGRTGFVGMIRSAEMAHSVHEPKFDAGIDEALHARGLFLVRDMLDEDEDGRPASEAPRIVRENAVDGLLINYAFGTPRPVRELLDRSSVPAIWINRKLEANCVRPNDQGAAYEATRYLLECGHRRIAFAQVAWRITEVQRLEPHYSGADRRAGYEQAMAEAGLTPQVTMLPAPSSEMDQKNSYLLRRFMGFLQTADRCTAVLCPRDGRVMLHAAALQGLSVPEDLSVFTLDNDAGADEQVAVDRALVRYQAMGHAAVGELCALIEDPQTPRDPVVIPFEFHKTGTVARPRESS